MKIHLLLICGAALMAMVSCKKEVNELPPATQTGANTFGAKVDGQLWVPAGFGFIPDNDILRARKHPNGFFYIYAQNFSSSPVETEFEIFIKNLDGPGIYLLNTDVTYPTTSANYGYYVRRNFTPNGEWLTSSQFNGSITITTVDTVKQFVSGTFFFNALSAGGGDTLMVTEGRFDVSTKL